MKELQRKCAICKTKRPISEMYSPPSSMKYTCSPHINPECATALSMQLLEKKRKKEDREFRAETKRRKLAAKGRLDWYKTLGALVNQYAKHVEHKGKPCYTCGKEQSHNDSAQAFHAGHYKPAKQVDPRRFMLCNLRIQCYTCNSANSGRGAEYRRRLTEEKGIGFVEWLERDASHPSLKELFPEISDIENEVKRYRGVLRKHGITPISR